MRPEEINAQAYKYAESTVFKLREICNPLFKTDIKTFAYFRFFHNGRYLYLCNDLNWVQFCLQNVHSNEGTSLGREIGHVPEDNYHCYLWPTLKTDYLMLALYEFNIWNGLSIFKQNEESIELWGFAADRQSENIKNFYIENLEILKNFTASFNLNASELILPNNDNLAIYKNFKLQYQIDEYNEKIIREFIKATPINKRPIITPSGEIFLPTKELQCLNFLASGKNTRQIALELKVSTRTIEKYFEKIKQKIDGDKSTIIQVYKNSVLNWL